LTLEYARWPGLDGHLRLLTTVSCGASESNGDVRIGIESVALGNEDGRGVECVPEPHDEKKKRRLQKGPSNCPQRRRRFAFQRLSNWREP